MAGDGDAAAGRVLALLAQADEVKRLELRPGDRLVLRYADALTGYQAQRLTDVVPVLLGVPGLRVLVVDRGGDVAVVGPAEDVPEEWGRLWQPGHP